MKEDNRQPSQVEVDFRAQIHETIKQVERVAIEEGTDFISANLIDANEGEYFPDSR